MDATYEFRFDYLCGHVHKIYTFPFNSSPTFAPTPNSTFTPGILPTVPEDEATSTTQSDWSARKSEEVHLFPTLCAKCQQVGIISDYFSQIPGARVDVIRAWKEAQKRNLLQTPVTDSLLETEIEEAERFDDEFEAVSTGWSNGSGGGSSSSKDSSDVTIVGGSEETDTIIAEEGKSDNTASTSSAPSTPAAASEEKAQHPVRDTAHSIDKISALIIRARNKVAEMRQRE